MRHDPRDGRGGITALQRIGVAVLEARSGNSVVAPARRLYGDVETEGSQVKSGGAGVAPGRL